MKIAVVYSLPTARMSQTGYAAADEDTSEIAKMVARGLSARGHKTTLHPIGEQGISEIARIEAEGVFNLIEWCGLDIRLAKEAFGQLRQLGVPVTGSREALFELTGDKILLKRALGQHGVSVPWGVGIKELSELPEQIPYPVIVKPHLEHCSIGLKREVVAQDEGQLKQIVQRQLADFEQDVLVEEFVPGRELLVYLIEEKGRAKLLPIVEMLFEGNDPMAFQTYEAKWVVNSRDYQQTYYQQAELTPDEYERIAHNCTTAFEKLGLWGYARFDLRLREGVPYILEANANPSVYDAEEEIKNIEDEVIEGIKFPDYLQKIVEAAMWHYERGERV